MVIQLIFQFKPNIILIKPIARIYHHITFQKQNVLNAENFTGGQYFPHFFLEGRGYICCSSQYFKRNELVMFSLIAAKKNFTEWI